MILGSGFDKYLESYKGENYYPNRTFPRLNKGLTLLPLATSCFKIVFGLAGFI
jgi:hypothetical protein